MSQLWDFAKQIAQSEGRRNDWVYIIDVYKSVGGFEKTLFILTESGKKEVHGEASDDDVLVSDVHGKLEVMKKSDYKRCKKKFYNRDLTGADTIEKSIKHNGKMVGTKLYINAKLN